MINMRGDMMCCPPPTIWSLKSGFSLVEILICVGIMALVGIIMLPSIRGKVPLHHLDGAVSSVVAELRAARTQAVSESRPVEAEVDGDLGTLTVKTDRNGNGYYETGEKSVLDLSKYKGVSIEAATPTGIFRPRGSFYCPDGFWKITVSSTRAGKRFVYVFAGGQVEQSEEPLS